MRARQVLIFLLGVFALIGVGWLAFPADGVQAGPLTLRFPSYRKMVAEASETKVNVDSVLTAVEERFRMQEDTLSYYHDFFYNNPDRIFLPDDDYTFFDPVFRKFEEDSSIVRVIHYGDSTTQRAGHNRYGIMAQVVQMAGGGTISLRGTRSKTARERTKTFQTVTLLYGRASGGFKASAVSDTLKPKASIERLESGTTIMRWDFGRPVDKVRINLSGNAEIYAITADGASGVAVDNIPLRGCSGTIFSRISKPLMAESMRLENAGLIILQFGGNYMPVANSSKVISNYCTKIAEQIQYFHSAAPQAKILFIGPSDMGTSRNGRIVTRPRLPEMVDSLKATALRNDAAYWDLFRMMGGENSMVQWVKHVPPYAGADYTHFTPAGAQKVGEALSRSFLTYYDYYRLRNEK